jgi:predicted DNA-binding transcriptional regulator YafY
LEKDKKYLTVSVPVAIGDQFFGWLLSMGTKVTIVEPPEVKKQMVELMTRVMRNYSK